MSLNPLARLRPGVVVPSDTQASCGLSPKSSTRRCSLKPPLRTKSVGTKVSEAEFALLEERARGAGMRLAEWVREALLAAPVEPVAGSGVDSGEVGGWPRSKPTTDSGAPCLAFETWVYHKPSLTFWERDDISLRDNDPTRLVQARSPKGLLALQHSDVGVRGLCAAHRWRETR